MFSYFDDETREWINPTENNVINIKFDLLLKRPNF